VTSNLGDVLERGELVRMKCDVMSLYQPLGDHFHLRCVPHLHEHTRVVSLRHYWSSCLHTQQRMEHYDDHPTDSASHELVLLLVSRWH